MKKRIVSLLLVFCLIFAMLPSMTVESDAIIGSILKVGFKVCKSVIKGTIVTAKNRDHYNGNVGKAVLGQFKNIAADLTGADIGEDYGDGEVSDTEEIITKADLDEIKNQMQTISSELEKTNNAIYQLESTVTEGMRDLSEQLSELNKKLDQLSGEVSNAAQLNRYYTYLNEFFSFFNQYFEAISYYDEQLSYAVDGQRSESYIKNTFDRFYHLENVEYNGNLDSAVDKLGRYMRGEYVSTESGSLIDVLSTYYILTYKASNKCTDKEAQKAAAAALEDMIGYIYYSYCMGVYYREAVMMYQSTYMEEHETDEYLTDFGTYVIQDQLDDDLAALCNNSAITAGAVMGSLYTNFSGGTLSLDYYLDRNDDGSLGYGFTRTVSSTGFTMQRGWAQKNGQCCYLPDAAEGISSYFSDELRDAFMGLTTYKINEDTDNYTKYRVKLSEGNRLDTYSMDGTATLDICVLDRAIASIEIEVERREHNSIQGYGTEEFPYVITSAGYFRNLIEGYFPSDAHYVLVNDITFDNVTIKKVANFSGVLDGNGHTVTNLTIKTNSSTYTGGMFAELSGTVKNLTLKNANITVNCEKDTFVYAGAIAGVVKDGGLIYRCSVIDSTVTAQCSYSTTAANPVYSSMETLAGGIAGVIQGGKIDSCIVSETNIEAKPGSYVQGSCAGGLVASAYGGVVSNCAISYYTNTAKIKAGTSAGGFICYMNYGVTLHNGIAVIQYDPLDALNKAPIAEYYNNYWEENGRKKCTVSGKFAFIDRSGSDLWSGDHFASVAVNVSSNGKYKYDPAYKFNFEYGTDVYIRNYFGTDGMVEFNNYVSGTGMPEFKSVTIKIDDDSLKTVYLEGETFNCSGISGYIYDAAGNKMSKLFGYTLKPCRNMSFDSPLTKDGIATDSDGNKYDCYQCELIYNGTVLKTYNIYVRSAHVYIQSTVPATCTEAGSSVLVCIDCGATKEQKTIPALGHHAVTDPAVSATCNTDGLTEGSHCERCGEVIVAQTAVPSTGEHGHTVIKGYEATCTTDGLTDKDYCEGCGLVHTEATVIPATGHSMKGYTIIEATCSNAGVVQEKCEICGEYGDFKAIEALGHTWTATVVEPTHTEIGYTVYQCTSCRESYQSDYTAPIGHTFGSSTVTKAATCTSEGILTYSCSCGNSHTVSIPKTEHELVSKVTDPTCTDFGYTTHSCKHCDYSYIEAYTAPHHTGEVQWVCTEKYHTSSYSCCGQVDGSRESHDWENGVCHTCGYICAHPAARPPAVSRPCVNSAECTTANWIPTTTFIWNTLLPSLPRKATVETSNIGNAQIVANISPTALPQTP